jgi:hypothetical protein
LDDDDDVEVPSTTREKFETLTLRRWGSSPSPSGVVAFLLLGEAVLVAGDDEFSDVVLSRRPDELLLHRRGRCLGMSSVQHLIIQQKIIILSSLWFHSLLILITAY